jgi:hypothetical protein
MGCPASLRVTFELHIPQRKETLRCQVKWWGEHQIGVQFERAPTDTSADRTKLADLEAEILRLRGVIKKLQAELAATRTNGEPPTSNQAPCWNA